MNQCVYCFKKSREITREHVISRNLFPDRSIAKFIIVPCCKECNSRLSFDEEYFRIFLCNLSLDKSSDANELFFSKIKRSIKRNPKIGWKNLNSMSLVNLYSQNGIYLGERTKIHISKKDWKRYHNVLDKYVKGLFYHEFKVSFPKNFKIEHVFGSENSLKKYSNLIGQLGNWNKDNEKIFTYAYSFVPESHKSIWLTIFFNSIFFITFVAEDKDFHRGQGGCII